MNHRFLVVVFLCAACAATHETDEPEWPGPQDDGTIALHNGWRLAPHGEQLRLDSDLPLRMAWHPGGRYLAIQHAGYRDHRIAVLDSRTDEVFLQLELPRTWSGFAWSGDGERLFVSGGVDDVVHVFAFDPHADPECGQRVALQEPGPDANPFEGVIARMQPKGALIPVGLGSGRPLPSAYLVVGASSVPPSVAGSACNPRTRCASEMGHRLSVGRSLHEEQ